MKLQTRHLLRLAMRCFYTATGFFVAILTAAVAHDGLAPAGGLLPPHAVFLVAAAVTWAIAVVIDGLTSEPGHHSK